MEREGVSRDWFLYLTTFVCGTSVMAVELSCTRFLAPYYGASSITWTVVIGVIMIALSLGNLYGGRIADEPGIRRRMYRLIWAASVWIALIPLVGRHLIAASFLVLMWIFPGQILTAGVLFSCIAIFTFPCFVLGAVTPCLIKLAVRDLDTTGRIAGEIYAVSTIGSIIGTFLPTFLTIPVMGTCRTFFAFALLLNLVATRHFLREGLLRKRAAVTTVAVAALLAAPLNLSFAFWKDTVLEDESDYNYIQVTRDRDTLQIGTHVEINRQSVYRGEGRLSESCFDLPLLAPFFRRQVDFQEPLRILILGFGSGTAAKLCKHFFPRCEIDGVEIDPKILALSVTHFHVRPDEARMFTDDGRGFLRRPGLPLYDVVFLDAYRDVTVPFHMATREFFQQVRGRMREGGVVVMNINMHSSRDPSLFDHLSQTLRSVMPRVWLCRVPGVTNLMMFASADEACGEHFRRHLALIGPDHPLFALSRHVAADMREIAPGPNLLTDDLAPVEILGQRVLQDMLEEGMKELFAALFAELRRLDL